MLLATYVNRGASTEDSGGLLVIDETSGRILKEVLAPVPLYLDDYDLCMHGKRGLGGIACLNGWLYVASFDSILVMDAELRITRRITHPWFNALHGITAAKEGGLWVTSTGLETLLRIDDQGNVLERYCLAENPALVNEPRFLDWSIDFRRPVFNCTLLHPNHVSELDGEVYVSLCREGDIWALRTRRRVLASLGIQPWRCLHDGKVYKRDKQLIIVGNSSDIGLFHCLIIDPAGVVQYQFMDMSLLADQDPTRPESHGRLGWLRGLHLDPDGTVILGQATAKIILTSLGGGAQSRVIPLNRGPTSSIVEVQRITDPGFLLRG